MVKGEVIPMPGAWLWLKQWEKGFIFCPVGTNWGSSEQGCSCRLQTSSCLPSTFLPWLGCRGCDSARFSQR